MGANFTNKIQVLLIDDDEDDFVNIRDLLRDTLDVKYVLTWESSYQAGAKALSEAKFDVCLLDHRLGERTGLELLREFKSLLESLPIIFLTGQGDSQLDLEAMQIGAADYLVKGQISSQLLDRSIRYSIKHALDKSELRERREEALKELSQRKQMESQVLQQDRLASLGLLASSLAHEIGTPMGIIRGRAELMAKRYAQDSKLKEDSLLVITQIDRITKLVNSLLHLARGNHSSNVVSVKVNDALQDILNLIRHEFDRKGIELLVKLPLNCAVMAEAGPLGQVFLNLLVNSIHAIDDAIQKGRVSGHQVEVKAETKDKNLEISVRDTGSGISRENLGNLFKPFFSTKDVGQGTGLGLATSYRLVQSWGGQIRALSDGKSGSTFMITLPLSKS